MYGDVMRTQVTLGKEELELLDRAAKASGASRSNSSDAQFTVPTGLDPSRNGSPRSTTAVARGEDGLHRHRVCRRHSGRPQRTTCSARSGVKLIDTTIAVDHLRGEPAAAVLLAELINNGEEIAASELVRFELLAGVRESELAALEAFFSAVVWTLVTEDIARIGGRLARRYRSSHRGIDDVDYLIAATAIVVDADLLTTNVRHFPMFPDLQPPY